MREILGCKIVISKKMHIKSPRERSIALIDHSKGFESPLNLARCEDLKFFCTLGAESELVAIPIPGSAQRKKLDPDPTLIRNEEKIII